MSKVFATYKKHYHDDYAEGHIYLDKKGACTITLRGSGFKGAAVMSQDELDRYGEAMAEALNKENEDENDDYDTSFSCASICTKYRNRYRGK